jgi:predicted ATPase
MRITRLTVENFKSFDTLDVEFGDFNVFIGANASGKSNFLSILAFLRDIARDGLEDAVSMQGGEASLLQNAQLRDSKPTAFELWIESGQKQPSLLTGDQDFRVETTHYMLTLRNGDPQGFKIEQDEFTSHLEPIDQSDHFSDEEEVENTLVVVRKNGRLNVKEGGRFLERAGTGTYDHSAIPRDLPLLATSFFPVASLSETRDLSLLPLFDFHPSTLQSTSPSSGPSRLEEDGKNVALVLRTLLRDDEKRRTFLNLARALLPFVEDLDVDRFAGESLLVKLQESYAEDTYLPASLLSDGTIKVVALLIALYFEDRPIIAFEEPASNLHPKLISQLMQMMREASEKKQIFITTHNPEVIRHVDLENLYLVSRDDDGFSQITKPNDSEIVRHFLKNDLGIGDLFVQNLL